MDLPSAEPQRHLGQVHDEDRRVLRPHRYAPTGKVLVISVCWETCNREMKIRLSVVSFQVRPAADSESTFTHDQTMLTVRALFWATRTPPFVPFPGEIDLDVVPRGGIVIAEEPPAHRVVPAKSCHPISPKKRFSK